MRMQHENKQTFFELTVTLNLPTPLRIADNDRIQQQIDLIYSKLQVGNMAYQFESKKAMVFLFKCEKRKRLGLITTTVHKYLAQYTSLIYSWEATSLTKSDFETQRDKYYPLMKLIQGPTNDNPHYFESDIKILDDPKNLYKWQKTLLNILFENGEVSGKVTKPDPRKIIVIRDPLGCGGKTILLKWLLKRRNQEDDIGVLTSGTASQLRSYIINIGPNKRVYILDLPRAYEQTTNWKSGDIFSVLELLKSGLLCSSMFGQQKSLLIDPPHIVIFANGIIEPDLLSADRWQVYEMDQTNKDPDIKLEKLRGVKNSIVRGKK
jgi:hypothetical protein